MEKDPQDPRLFVPNRGLRGRGRQRPRRFRYPCRGNPDGGNQSEPFIDRVLASGIKSGYRFVSLPSLGGPGVAPGFQAFAIPTSPGQSGFQQLFVDETQVIRQTNDGTAVGPASPPLD